MNVITEQRGNVRCLHIDGELTIYAAAPLKAALLDALTAATELEVDLADVTEIDTAGIQLLIAAKREAAEAGTPMRMVGHSTAVLGLMELYELASWFGDPLVLSAVRSDRQGVAA